MPTILSCITIGRGPQLMACMELWLRRGHRVSAVVTDCADTAQWCARHGVARVPDGPGLTERLSGAAGVDYLFSIVNHAILAPEVLRLPRRAAINYHDSLLPEHAGFNATSWAILDGKTHHGITFHVMSEAVDGGRILAQVPIEIGSDDTAFTLSAKCGQTAVTAFEQLLPSLEAFELEGSPQAPGGSFHRRSERLDVALLDFARPARELSAKVRALTFASEDNWMSTPKVRVFDGYYSVGETTLLPNEHGAPFEVLGISARGLTIAASQGALCLNELFTLEGAPVEIEELARKSGLSVGQTLPFVDAQAASELSALDAQVTKHERFWVKRLREQHGPQWVGVDATASSTGFARAPLALPAPLAARPVKEQRARLIASLFTYAQRTANRDPFDLALSVPLEPGQAALYAESVPFRCEPSAAMSFGALADEVDAALTQHLERRTFARDLVQRYAALRGRPPLALTVGVLLARFAGKLPQGVQLCLVMPEDAPAELVWNEAAMSRTAVQELSQRLFALLSAAETASDTALSALPICSDAEQQLLLHTFQDTATDYERDACMHTLFERQVDLTPDATALTFANKSVTYRELDALANRVAQVLIEDGVGADSLVAISVERSIAMVAGLLGILKAGGAYVPLDPAYPEERLGMMLEDSKAQVLLAQARSMAKLPHAGLRVHDVDALLLQGGSPTRPGQRCGSHNLAYVIFTSGSTGRPKGVMIEHRNVSNFFTGMDQSLGHRKPGVWLAVTSISFDISVLELFWTLSRGFEVVLQQESDRASLTSRAEAAPTVSAAPMDFSLFYFAADSGSAPRDQPYRLLLEGARFADTHDFSAVWTPERHFHAFGGLYPNPAVTTAALSTITSRVHLRAGSVVLPLHNPLRVAEDWSVIDNLSGGRIGLSFASGWHVNDFAFAPENYEKRHEVMQRSIETVLALFRGETVRVNNGAQQEIEVSALPRPIQTRPPVWIASAGNVATFELAGRLGFNVLTNMLGQDLQDLRVKLAAYRRARAEAGHLGEGTVTVMLHTFVCADTEHARAIVKKPFCDYLKSSFDLVKVAPWMFPAFKRPSASAPGQSSFDAHAFSDEDMDALLDHAFDRYFETAGLFGSPERALSMVEALKGIGVNEVACLIDFGVPTDEVLASLPHLDRLRRLSNRLDRVPESGEVPDLTIAEQIENRKVTHLQCTPSMARMLLSDPEATRVLPRLEKLLLGGEALPVDLVTSLSAHVQGDIHNMYGPTETTIWSTTSRVDKHGAKITIGKPIANTQIRILDERGGLMPIGVEGELTIGGAGVVRGYLGRPDLTAERFIADPYAPGQRLYRTGDLARFNHGGEIEFLGRLDHQVKVSGYRIELGEIETCISKHPSVRQNVVVARTLGAGAQALVGYVVPKGAVAEQDPTSRIRHWQSRWDEAYASNEYGREASDARFDTSGWTDSFTGELVPREHMRAWLDAIRDRILTLKPKRVLEIGCGTGMVLHALLPHIEHYTGLDVSAQAISTVQGTLAPNERDKVRLYQRAAHELSDLAERPYDVVVINSVAQYFPDAAYLKSVIATASTLIPDGGHVFLGDLRSYRHLELFHTLVEAHKAAPGALSQELVQSIAKRVASEPELTVSEALLVAVKSEVSRVSGVEVQLKASAPHDEMSLFRFDATLHIGATKLSSPALGKAQHGVRTLAQIEALLADQPHELVLEGIPNARLFAAQRAKQLLSSRADLTGAELTDSLSHPVDGVDPASLTAIAKAYQVDLRWSEDCACFDAVLRRRGEGPLSPLLVEHAHGPEANQPSARQSVDLGAELREHVKRSLPEYMVPAAFVVLDALPLTPNGKIDRKALPAPEEKKVVSKVEYAAPASDLESQLATIWQDLLGVARVGRADNIFDLGANSLLTVQAGQRLSAAIGRRVPLVSLFRFPTIAALAAHLAESETGQATGSVQRATAERDDRKREAAERRRRMRRELSSGESE